MISRVPFPSRPGCGRGNSRYLFRVAAPLAAAMALGLVLAGAIGTHSAAAAPALQGCAGNRLANPGFEGGSRKTESEGTSLSSAVSDGWHPWFVRGGEQVNREPEFKLERVSVGGDPQRIHSGGSAMKWFSTWSTHTAGLYQRVAVPAGTMVTFSMHGLAYSGEADGWSDEAHTFLSDHAQPGNYRMAVGIDPTGAVPAGAGSPPPASVIWSEPTTTVDTWVRLAVSTPARAGAVTVYAKGWPEWGVKHNDSFWDDACLTVGGAAPAPIDSSAAAPAEAASQGATASQAAASAPASLVASRTAARQPGGRLPGARHFAIPR